MLQPAAPDTDPVALLILQFLAWVEERPRGYDETMEAWRTSCPRLPVWEDATAERLVRLEAGDKAQGGGTWVTLTEMGRDRLRQAQARR